MKFWKGLINTIIVTIILVTYVLLTNSCSLNKDFTIDKQAYDTVYYNTDEFVTILRIKF